MSTTTIDRAWIASEFLKMVESERSLLTDAKARAESPPLPGLAVLYHQIAEQDETHVAVLETIATRYGHTPTRSAGSGMGETLGRLKDRIISAGTSPVDLVRQDLASKDQAIDWQSAWADTFEAIEDNESARDLKVLVTADQAHREALLQGLKRLLEQRATSNEPH